MGQLEQCIADKVKVLTKVPCLQKVVGCLTESEGIHLISTWSQHSLETSESVKFEKSFVMKGSDIFYKGPPQYVDSRTHVSYSPSLKRKIVFRPKSDMKKDGEFILDVWSDGCLLFSIDLEAAKHHGAPYLSGDFASFDWNNDESRFLYVAERRRPAAASFFDPAAPADAEPGAESRWYEDWGEQMDGQHESVVVLVDVDSAIIQVLEGEKNVTLGQARWFGTAIYAIAWRNFPRRLGLIYCSNRSSHVVKFERDDNYGTMIPLLSSVSPIQSCRSIRVSPTGKHLIWLQSDASGPHHKGARLMRLDSETQEHLVVLDTVPIPDAADGFSGIYAWGLPTPCFTSETELCFSTQEGTRMASFTVDILSGKRTRHQENDIQILAALPGLICGVKSTLLQPHQLVVKRDSGEYIVFNEYPIPVKGDVRHMVFTRPLPEDLAHIPFTGMLVTPSTASDKMPLIVFPHGGPHGVMVDWWSSHVALFCQLGFAVVMVNYRGSAGAGERSLHALPGRVGDLDVGDCAHVVRQVLVEEPRCDPAQVGAYGGSHGGFLVTHLSGQFPDMLAAVVARNPVCDIAGMLEGTDIPDWNFVESGFCYGPGAVPSGDQLAEMLRRSPMAHVDRVRAPTLIMLGTVDRRVVPCQAFYYHQALVSRGVCTDVRVYEDWHPLAKPAVNGDVMVHASVWFCKYFKFDPLSELSLS